MRATQLQLYAQDSYKATSRLTLNVGLRYELPQPYSEIHNKDALFVPGRAVDGRADCSAGPALSRRPGRGAGTLIPTGVSGLCTARRASPGIPREAGAGRSGPPTASSMTLTTTAKAARCRRRKALRPGSRRSSEESVSFPSFADPLPAGSDPFAPSFQWAAKADTAHARSPSAAALRAGLEFHRGALLRPGVAAGGRIRRHQRHQAAALHRKQSGHALLHAAAAQPGNLLHRTNSKAT